jgi:hypothetical protein
MWTIEAKNLQKKSWQVLCEKKSNLAVFFSNMLRVHIAADEAVGIVIHVSIKSLA